MASESVHENPTPPDTVGSADKNEDQSPLADGKTDLPVNLSEFSQRLASFGLGEAPDPLLTESLPPSKRSRSR